MINKKNLILALALILSFCNATYCFGLSEAKITVKVIDETGSPVEGARVGLGFYVGGTKSENAVIGFTDSNGSFTATSAVIVQLGGNVKKDGYYESRFYYEFKEVKNGKWLPWNPEVTLVMRKKENPVAMYAHKFGLDIPTLGKEVGFDLIEYDWVAPHGKGKQADFIFKVDQRFVSRDDYDCTLIMTFPNKFDGIQLVKEDRRYGSRLKLPRYAPENGYQKKLTRFSKRVSHAKPFEEDYKEDNNYIFRVRSEEKDGKLVRAMYGKIQGDIRVGPENDKTAYISFKYYLNSDYTRNLEFDPKQNLFKGLKSTEQVGLE